MQTTHLVYVLALIRDPNTGEVLLIKRAQNRHLGGAYSLIGGKLDANETLREGLCRELDEEIGLRVRPDDLEFAHLFHFKGEADNALAVVFILKEWGGVPVNKEPDKHDEIAWFSIDHLPASLLPRHRQAIWSILKQVPYSELNWGS